MEKKTNKQINKKSLANKRKRETVATPPPPPPRSPVAVFWWVGKGLARLSSNTPSDLRANNKITENGKVIKKTCYALLLQNGRADPKRVQIFDYKCFMYYITVHNKYNKKKQVDD